MNLGSSSLSSGATLALTKPLLSVLFSSLRLTETQAKDLSGEHRWASFLRSPQGTSPTRSTLEPSQKSARAKMRGAGRYRRPGP